nr:META domain-containing protein [uncultured Chryseobacterium sp.]
MLVEFDDFTRQQLIENKAEINLTGEKTGNNKIKGNASMGCNKILYVTEFKKNGRLKISGLGSTEMACKNSSLEDDFLRKFDKMNRYTIVGHQLILSDKGGNKMKFIAADWD